MTLILPYAPRCAVKVKSYKCPPPYVSSPPPRSSPRKLIVYNKKRLISAAEFSRTPEMNAVLEDYMVEPYGSISGVVTYDVVGNVDYDIRWDAQAFDALGEICGVDRATHGGQLSCWGDRGERSYEPSVLYTGGGTDPPFSTFVMFLFLPDYPTECIARSWGIAWVKQHLHIVVHNMYYSSGLSQNTDVWLKALSRATGINLIKKEDMWRDAFLPHANMYVFVNKNLVQIRPHGTAWRPRSTAASRSRCLFCGSDYGLPICNKCIE